MTVEPIRDRRKITLLQNYIKDNHEPMYYLIFMLGLNIGLRVGDIVKLEVKDIMNFDNTFKDYVTIREQKTNKERRFKLNDVSKGYVSEYIKIKNLNFGDLLFKSRKGGKRITRVQVFRILKEAATAVGISNFGTHTMRKTWGYWSYIASKNNIGLIQSTLNHSSPAVTLRYIGVNQDQKDELYQTVQF